jgi:hypothetical protein
MDALVAVVLGLCTLAGGIWAVVHFGGWVRRRSQKPILPTYSAEQLRRRLRILAIDDSGFVYFKDFKNDDYQIDKLARLTNYSKLEGYRYDLLILDIRGIAADLSDDDGLGVATHVRSTMESMPVIIYSGASYQLEVDRSAADEIFPISGDYQRMKSTVDRIFASLTEPSFFLRFFDSGHGSTVSPADRSQLEADVTQLLVDPSSQLLQRSYSNHTTATRANEITRHCLATSKRLHQTES